MDEIRTTRLALRNFKAEDAQDLLAYLRDPRPNCFLSQRLQNLEEAEAEAIKRGGSDDYIAVYSTEHDRVIGDLFAIADEEGDTLSVGWNFNGDYAGCGYAQERLAHCFAGFSSRGRYVASTPTSKIITLPLRSYARGSGCAAKGCSWTSFPSPRMRLDTRFTRIQCNMHFCAGSGRRRHKAPLTKKLE